MSVAIIFQRRSIRKYTDKPVDHAAIQTLLEAGMAAPSANNHQPWHFVVVTEREILDALAAAHPYGKMLSHATLAIAVLGDPALSSAYWVQDCAAATENILIAAAGLGLGAVWLGCTQREERVKAVQDVLHVPREYPVLSLMALGHPAEEKPARTQYSKDKVHWNGW